ncbi:MAG: flotillin-like FloA family protein, partial [Planctomycetes bacterium]|nr:flotillin-like FloA family protein [Planctomycetota bacterium]
AEIDVGANIGAELQANQAAADLRVAQAQAEVRRAAAVAREQEMKALVEENRAKVVLAEAEVPLALAFAFREGRMGVMDYYNLRNVQSDTEMRNAIAGTGNMRNERTTQPPSN